MTEPKSSRKKRRDPSRGRSLGSVHGELGTDEAENTLPRKHDQDALRNDRSESRTGRSKTRKDEKRKKMHQGVEAVLSAESMRNDGMSSRQGSSDMPVDTERSLKPKKKGHRIARIDDQDSSKDQISLHSADKLTRRPKDQQSRLNEEATQSAHSVLSGRPEGLVMPRSKSKGKKGKKSRKATIDDALDDHPAVTPPVRQLHMEVSAGPSFEDGKKERRKLNSAGSLRKKNTSRSHESLSRRNVKPQREGSIKLKSPLTDQYVTLPLRDIIPTDQPSQDRFFSEDDNATIKSSPDDCTIDVVFVEDNGRFRPISSAFDGRSTRSLPEDLDQSGRQADMRDQLLEAFAVTTHLYISRTIHAIHGLYAGACFLCLALLPSFSGLEPAPTAAVDIASLMQNPTFQYYAYYTSYCAAVSRIMNILATFAAIDMLEAIFGLPAHCERCGFTWWRYQRRKTAMAVVLISCTTLTWLSAMLITVQDDRLYHSNSLINGPYGPPDWFTSIVGLNQAIVLSDLSRWRALNCVRGMFGVLTWCISRWVRLREIRPSPGVLTLPLHQSQTQNKGGLPAERKRKASVFQVLNEDEL
ncbi:hypothetical protein DFS34DRAFT_118526 [Phlyctochytrium arcticum]|nr:hypothetical protein DFS34DRAFT_118526 [Phlyctochytrium arcticum]